MAQMDTMTLAKALATYTLAELVARGVVKGIQHPSPELVQAMMRYNDEKTVMP
jgi:hypothetical protein